MSFYTGKSIRVGPMRFSLSKSGVSASVGIKGLRFGTGPRGITSTSAPVGFITRLQFHQARRPKVEARLNVCQLILRKNVTIRTPLLRKSNHLIFRKSLIPAPASRSKS
ncbi:DUF4236 domain-containing protein [Apirhabdus apintestini]|nr:DUF4236 domain-containing protein [Enterobacteriaceae bacterium CA-0114]